MIANFSSGEWVFVVCSIVASITTAIVTIIVAVKTTRTHDAVNSRMSAFLAEQKVETAKILTMAIEKAHGEGVKQTLEIQKATAPALPAAGTPPMQEVAVVIAVPDADAKKLAPADLTGKPKP